MTRIVVKAGEPPSGPMTLSEWKEWRAAEDARMWKQLQEKMRAAVAANEALIERELNGETSH